MTNKEKIIKYCETVETHCMDHLQGCQDVLSGLTVENCKNYILDHCPSAFGLDDFNGLCHTEGSMGTVDQCKRCWAMALEE